MKLDQMKRAVQTTLMKHSSEITTGFGVAALISAIGFAIKATPTACALIEERKLDEEKDELTPLEVVQTTWKCYVPTVVSAAAGATCVMYVAHNNYKRNAALTAAYGLAQESMQIYREKVIDALGEKKEAEIREEADREQIKRHPHHNIYEVNPIPPDTLCYFEERYWYCNWEKIRRAIQQLAEDQIESPYLPRVCLNDFFELVGLGYTDMGNKLFWDLNINGKPEIYPPSCIELETGQICFVLTFSNPPILMN